MIIMSDLPRHITRPLAIATIGCGRMGAALRPDVDRIAPAHMRVVSHLGAIRALDLPIARLTAADVSEELRTTAQAQHNLDAVYADHTALLAAETPDILTVATRTPPKPEIVQAALAQGIRSLHVEKPLCLSEAERRALAEAFAPEDVLVTSGCLRRYLAPYHAARDWLSDDQHGAPLDIQINMGPTPLAWTQFHALDLALFLAAGRQVALVQANLGPLEATETPGGAPVIENDPSVRMMLLEFEDGLVARIGQGVGTAVTLTVSKTQGQYELFSDGHQAFEAMRPTPDNVYLQRREIPVPEGGLGGSAAPIGLLASAHCGHGPAQAEIRRNMDDFLEAQRLSFAALLSALDGGRRVDPSEVPEGMVFQAKTGTISA